MKKLLLLFVAVCATFASCEDDDDNRFEGNAGAFVGTTWECIDIYTEEGTDYKDVMTIKFEKDGKCVMSYVGYKKVDGNYVKISGDDEFDTGTYSVKGNKLTLIDSHSDGENGIIVATINDTEFTYIEKEGSDSYTYTFKLK